MNLQEIVTKLSISWNKDRISDQKNTESKGYTVALDSWSRMMTLMELGFIEKYFDKLYTEPKILNLIDRVLKNLKFFRRMDTQNRKEILMASKLIIYQPQDYVIKQGDIGNHMYVIIKGWINVKIELKFNSKK